MINFYANEGKEKQRHGRQGVTKKQKHHRVEERTHRKEKDGKYYVKEGKGRLRERERAEAVT